MATRETGMETTATRKGAARAARILDETLAFIIEHGQQDLTLDAIARRAGIAKGNLQYYFPPAAICCAQPLPSKSTAIRQIGLLMLKPPRKTTPIACAVRSSLNFRPIATSPLSPRSPSATLCHDAIRFCAISVTTGCIGSRAAMPTSSPAFPLTLHARPACTAPLHSMPCWSASIATLQTNLPYPMLLTDLMKPLVEMAMALATSDD